MVSKSYRQTTCLFRFLGRQLPPSKLQLVQIYFDTAPFDDIERDKKIKTEAQLSLIGGFSIISGEVLEPFDIDNEEDLI